MLAMKTRVLALILVISTSLVAVTASGQEIAQLPTNGVITDGIQIAPSVAETLPVAKTMASSSVPDAPLPRLDLPQASLASAGQQPGQSRPAGTYHHSSRQKDIVVGVIIVIAVVGLIVIATQRD